MWSNVLYVWLVGTSMEGRSKGQRMKNLFVRCLAPCGCWPVGLSSKGSASKKGDADAQWVVTTKESVLWEDYQVDLDEGKGTNPVTPALSVDESLISTAYQSVAPNLLELDSHDSHHGLPAVLVASSPGIISKINRVTLAVARLNEIAERKQAVYCSWFPS